MEHLELVTVFANNLEQERIKLNLTQAQMAGKLNISLSTYKRILTSEITKIDIYTLYLACKLTGKTSYEFLNEQNSRTSILDKLSNLTPSQLSYIENLIRFELSISTPPTELHNKSCDYCSVFKSCQQHNNTDYCNLYQSTSKNNNCYDNITVFVPTGNMQDGMIYDTSNLEKINISSLRKKFGDKIHFGIKVTSNHLHPAYNLGDILLVCTNPIRDGDTGIFVNKENNCVYIRKFHQTNPCTLEPINNYGETFYVDSHNKNDMDKWIKLGYIITKIRG